MEAYANDACRTVAAQVAEAVGFQGMTQSTADTLAEVLARYIEEVSATPQIAPAVCGECAPSLNSEDIAAIAAQVGYQSHSLTEMSNRTQDNALDVRQALVQCNTTLADLQVSLVPVRSAAQPLVAASSWVCASTDVRYGAAIHGAQ
jgi:hypothetical protein